MIALVGVVLQTAVLAFDGFIVYGKKLTKGGEKVSHYAYPFTFFGTAGVVISMYLCAYIIETSTNELEWKPQRLEGSPEDSKPTNQRVIWIQKSQTVGDQGFGSFAIYGPLGSSRYLMTSHRCRDRKRFHNLTTIASIISIVGM